MTRARALKVASIALGCFIGLAALWWGWGLNLPGSSTASTPSALPVLTSASANRNLKLSGQPYPRYVFATGDMTANRTWTPVRTTAVAGSTIRILRTATGDFDLRIGSLTVLRVNEYTDIIYNGRNWVLAGHGSIGRSP